MEHTLAGAAEATGVAKSTIFRAIKSGKLSARRLEDGTFRIDASELARVYPAGGVERAATEQRNVPQQAEGTRKPAAARASETELALLRLDLELKHAQAELAREREERERERDGWERERNAIKVIENQLGQERDELRKRIEDEKREAEQRLEEERDAAQRRLEEERQERREAQQKLMEKPQDPPAMVEDLRKRLEDTEAWIAALTAPERPQDGQNRSPVVAEPPKAPRTLWGRLLGRG